MNNALRAVLPAEYALIATIGFLPEDEVSEPGWKPRGTVVDLDTVDPSRKLPDPSSGVVVVAARTATDLRRAITLSNAFPTASRVIVAVAESAHRPVPTPAFAPGQAWPRSVTAKRGSAGSWSIEVTFGNRTDVGNVLAAIGRGLARQRPLPVARVALAGKGSAHWRPGDRHVLLTAQSGKVWADEGVPRADIALRTSPAEPTPWWDDQVDLIDRPELDVLTWRNLSRLGTVGDLKRFGSIDSADQVPPVDEGTVSPAGFKPIGTSGLGQVLQDGERWAVFHEDKLLLRLHPSGNVTDADVARLRSLRGLEVDFGRHTGPVAAVRAVAGLACAGIPLVTTHVPPWADALGPDLVRALTAIEATELDDDLSRELHSIRLRRAALRTHSTRARWLSFARAARLDTAPESVSVVLTASRPELIADALAQVTRQSHPELELVLVLRGVPAALPEVRKAVRAFGRTIAVVEVESDVPLGVAINRGIEAASGRLVATWAAQDRVGPDHLSDLVLARHYSGAELVGCPQRLVYLEAIDLTVLRCDGVEQYDSPSGAATVLIDRHLLLEVGGFRPREHTLETSLRASVIAAGGRTYDTHGLGYLTHCPADGPSGFKPIESGLASAVRQWRGLYRGLLETVDSDEPAAPAPAMATSGGGA